MKPIHTLAATLVLAASQAFAAPAPLKAQAKQIIESNQDSIVWLSIIAKQEVGFDGDVPAQLKLNGLGGAKDKKMEISGSIVDPSGLIVSSLAAIGGSSIMDGQEVETPMGAIKLKAKTDIKEVKVIMPDGTEIPADVVMKDADLDLAFFKVRTDSPEAKDVKFKAINLKDSASVGLLDDLIALGRMDASMNRQPMAYTTEVLGIVKTPREIFSVQTLTPGSPVFTPEGKIVGLSVVRKPAGGISADGIHTTPAVLPAKDVLKIATQALEAKPLTASTESKDK